MATRYQLVQSVEGRFVVSFFDCLAGLEIRFGAPRSYVNRRGLRPELQGQPQFGALVGPMWGGTDEAGNPIVRYEDGESNDRLSA